MGEQGVSTPVGSGGRAGHHEGSSSPSPDWSDAALIEACLAGDERAWEILIGRYARLIYTIPLRFGLPKTVADEIFQEVCLILLERLDTLRDRERLGSWLMTVTRRTCIARWRGKSATIQHVELTEETYRDVGVAPEDLVIEQEEQQFLLEALKNLSPRCRRLIEILFFHDPPLSYEEIAQELGLPLGSIGPTRKRCLEKLRRAFLELWASGQTEVGE